MTKAELHDFYMTDDTEYCCYCSESRGSRLSCCQENHFVPFNDLYPEDQAALLEEMKDE